MALATGHNILARTMAASLRSPEPSRTVEAAHLARLNRRRPNGLTEGNEQRSGLAKAMCLALGRVELV